MHLITIEEINQDSLNDFIEYLKIHLSENGDDNRFFLPLSKEQSKFSSEWEEKFKNGLGKKFGETGWRKLWIGLNQENKIVGHIDIRSRNELNTGHRVLLGMGTDRNFRNLKVAQRLLAFVIKYCKDHSEISWLDLEVMTSNIPAIRIYEKTGFEVLSSVDDMFRIEGRSYGYASMTLNLDPK